MNLSNKRIWVTGHRGLVGSAIMRGLSTSDAVVLTAARAEVDLLDQQAVRAFISRERPDIVVIAAAKVGGIYANDKFPAEFLMENLQIETNIIDAAHKADVNRLLFLGSSCIYPRMAPQPISESALLTGPLEPTNQWYAIAKISGIMLCDAYRKQYNRSYISAMPTNLFGPRDNFHPETSHVIPALMNRFHNAKLSSSESVTIWGSGNPLREFMYVDDLADALIFLLGNYDAEGHINVGTGEEISIRGLAEMMAEVTGYTGVIKFDESKPDGTPRKLMDSSNLAGLGWRSKLNLRQGLEATYQWFNDNIGDIRIGPGQ